MISFIDKTWFLWWIVAVLMILRWFHVFSSGPESDREASALDEEQVAAIHAGQRPSGRVNRKTFAA